MYPNAANANAPVVTVRGHEIEFVECPDDPNTQATSLAALIRQQRDVAADIQAIDNAWRSRVGWRGHHGRAYLNGAAVTVHFVPSPIATALAAPHTSYPAVTHSIPHEYDRNEYAASPVAVLAVSLCNNGFPPKLIHHD